MASNDLFNYMRDATHQMQSEYARIRKRAVEDPGTAGDNGEENWAELLRRWLPPLYRVVTKGRIMNSKGDCGPQVDVLVLSPAYPEALIGKKEYLEGGVVAAFECKLTLKAEHLYAATHNAASIRRLSSPLRSGTPHRELHGNVVYGLLAHSHVWQGQESTPIENVEKHLLKAEAKELRHPKEVLDLICVSDLAVWSTLTFVVAGGSLLSQMRDRYQPLAEMWTAIQHVGGLVEVTHICSSERHQTEPEAKQLFTPIGSFLAALLQRLAWRDPSLQPLAEYFILANLLGSGQGSGRVWPLSVLSDELAEKLRKGNSLVTGERWNEWSMVL